MNINTVGGYTNTSLTQVLDRQIAGTAKKIISQYEAEHVVAMPRKEAVFSKAFAVSANPLGAIDQIFPSHQEESRIQQVRRIMGDEIKDLTDDELTVFITEFQYLIDSWFDEFERQVFNNKTLKEVLIGR